MSERFRVIFTGLSTLDDPAEELGKLAEAFGVDRAVIEGMVARAPIVVKRGVDQPTASRFQSAILAAGGRCKIELDLEETPARAEPAPARAPAPPADATAEPAPPRDPAPPADATAEPVPVPPAPAQAVPGSPPGPAGNGEPPSLVPAPQAPAILQEGQRPCPFCAEPIQAAALKCKHCGELLTTATRQPALSDYDADLLLSQGTWIMVGAILVAGLARVLLLSFGLEEQVTTTSFFIIKRTQPSGFGKLCIGLTYLMVPLSIWGAYQIAKAKGRHPAWSLFGLLSLVGLLVLRGLEDRRPSAVISREVVRRSAPATAAKLAKPARPLGRRIAWIASLLVVLLLLAAVIGYGVKRARRNSFWTAVEELDVTLGVDSEARFSRSVQDLRALLTRAASLVKGRSFSDGEELLTSTRQRLGRFLDLARASMDPGGRLHGQALLPIASELCQSMERANRSLRDGADNLLTAVAMGVGRVPAGCDLRLYQPAAPVAPVAPIVPGGGSGLRADPYGMGQFRKSLEKKQRSPRGPQTIQVPVFIRRP